MKFVLEVFPSNFNYLAKLLLTKNISHISAEDVNIYTNII